jgi:C-terminal processing protease CtpA/Prc
MACGPLSNLPGGRDQEEITLEPENTPRPPIAFDEEAMGDAGPVLLYGDVDYTNPFFTSGLAQPVIILEDQAGFVDRDKDFLMPVESQTLAQITSDVFEPPFTYSLALPRVPQGTLRDVDQDGETETGIMIFAVAYWENIWGDPYLEERDLGGGGWSTNQASTRIGEDLELENEIIGGILVIFAPNPEQSFPSGFGEDGKLFTEDDPIMDLPAGWSVIDLDQNPFAIIRDPEVKVDLYEAEGAALIDYSDQGYLEAYESMLQLFRTEYAFTEYKGVDWDGLDARFRPRFEEADQRNNSTLYEFALRDFVWSIPDGHMNVAFTDALNEDFRANVVGGLGIAVGELSDGTVLVTYLGDNTPASRAGIELRAEVLEINGEPVDSYVSKVLPFDSPFSTPHNLRLSQLTYATRFPLDTDVTITYRNPGDSSSQTANLTAEFEIDSYFASIDNGSDGYELPVEYDLLESGYVVVRITSFFDNKLLTIQLWERLMQTLNENEVPGLIVDLRVNGGGWGFIADQMAAHFFTEPLEVGQTGRWDEDRGEFYFDPDGIERFFLPPEDLHYDGPVVVIVSPSCASACEFFAYDMTIQDRATIIGHFPTAGLGGGVNDFEMPGGISVRFTVGRAVDMDGNIHIEGKGVAPDRVIPVTEESLFGDRDVLLEAAVAELDRN